jgi:hypothetical protein
LLAILDWADAHSDLKWMFFQKDYYGDVLMIERRIFLKQTALSVAMSGLSLNLCQSNETTTSELIDTIEKSIIWPGRTTGKTWFHPRACMVPEKIGPVALMTCQSISGSDVFSQVFWSRSEDNGTSWTTPEPIECLGRLTLENGIEEGVCDVVPDYHLTTNTVLAIGHNVYYKNNILTQAYENRYPVYTVGDAFGNWSIRKKLEWDHPETSGIYTCGCAQRITLEDGTILLPLSFGPKERADRKVCSVLCSFNGKELTVIRAGNELELSVKRGLLEPTLAHFDNRYYMTIRAEDGHGYVSASDDGLHWEAKQPWHWDDGNPITMSTTQQRWITHSHGLYLVYTRKSEHNINVMRWRAPLYISEVDTEKRCLIRASERVVFPLIGDGVHHAEHVARMGNFHTVNASQKESWITVGETLPNDGWKGNTLLGRVRWSRNNELVKRSPRKNG